MNVRISETGLEYTPWREWKKQFVLLLTMGSSSTEDAAPIVDLFKYVTGILGAGNRLYTIIGTRLVVINQVTMNPGEVGQLYSKLGLPVHLVEPDYLRSRKLLENCYEIGKRLGEGALGDGHEAI